MRTVCILDDPVPSVEAIQSLGRIAISEGDSTIYCSPLAFIFASKAADSVGKSVNRVPIRGTIPSCPSFIAYARLAPMHELRIEEE